MSKSISRGFTDERHGEGKRKGELKTNRYLKGTKNGGSRTLSLDEQTLNILKEWRPKQRKELIKFGYNALGSDQLIFSNYKNEYICTTLSRKWLVRIQEKYGLKKITTHGFRHTHCSLLFEAGANLKGVQERLGHKDSSITLDIYAHATKEAKIEAVSKFEKFMSV